MDFFVVEPSFQPLFAQADLADCHQTIRFFNKSEKGPFKKTWIKPAVLGSKENAAQVFYKQYCFAKPSWKFFGRASKAKREFENYAVFKKLNIACAQRIACGEERDGLGRLQNAFIITLAIPQTMPLIEFVPKHCPNRGTAESRQMRREMIEQLARMTRRIHEANFFHNDLFWRNVLVQWKPNESPKLWWIDCPRGKFVRWFFLRRHCRVKDLAVLDKSAEEFLSDRERIHFVKIYLGQERLDVFARKLIRDTLAYRKNRWSEK